ncbi:hypothetical protein [Burkholderia sp. Bp9142]|uniref:hypothetical protein n=1 Tax=Burkholderia sp. Bp9142 TaxID=2184573 RepID=UPI000F5A2CA1|nr:hypothetical protein [Burkholderia sp. Bp9142]
MSIFRGLVAVAMLAISFFSHAADFSKKFSPSPGAIAVVGIEGGKLDWRLSGKNGVRRGEVNFDTEKPLIIKIGSYDFSGRLGFWVSHADDGKGVYQVDRVFTFSPSYNGFVERFPSCGDEFVNLRVDKKRRCLMSTYWDRNIPKTCVTRLSIEE